MNNSKIEWQFCTKGQSLRLVELGVKPEALFWHIRAKSEKHGESIVYGWTSEAIAPAYSVAELGDMLPAGIQKRGHKDEFVWFYNGFDYDNGRLFNAGLTSTRNKYWIKKIVNGLHTEASARAGMLVSLLENNLFELPAHWRQNPDDAPEVHKVKICSQGSTEAIAG